MTSRFGGIRLILIHVFISTLTKICNLIQIVLIQLCSHCFNVLLDNTLECVKIRNKQFTLATVQGCRKFNHELTNNSQIDSSSRPSLAIYVNSCILSKCNFSDIAYSFLGHSAADFRLFFASPVLNFCMSVLYLDVMGLKKRTAHGRPVESLTLV